MVKFSNFFLSPPLERDTKLVKGMELSEVDKIYVVSLSDEREEDSQEPELTRD